MKHLAFAFFALLAACASPPQRPQRDPADLLASRRSEDAQRALERTALIERFLARVEAKAGATVDVLIVSGGGDWGAFGAGVLKGWGRVKGELARPQFDVVTGVSTGALIAPFAFLGDDASIERIVELYRNPQKDIATSRGWLFFLPDNPSFYVLPGLERELHGAIDRAMLERVVAEGAKGRGLLVNTTNVDLGDNRVWDLIAEAKRALAGEEDRVRRLLLASAGIPAVFPARGIGDYLFVDGAITGNIIYGGETREDQSLPARWHAKHPRRPMPRLRYWVIFNNQVRFPPQVTQDRWPDIMARTTIMATQTSTLNSLRHLYAMAEIARLKYKADIEVRLMTVPEDYVPSKPGTFAKEVMNELADLGERMGADPKRWLTEAP
ncbi:MAG TPA: patatin-like phospholipase family protein [Burkholderiales bacterium]|nr:patatin-like phospholipase family protein [Burkholderiales bacterium]